MRLQYFVTVVTISLIVLTQQRSFVDTAPVSTESGSEKQDPNENELEKLKFSGQLGKTVDLIKSQAAVYTNVNGEKESHSQTTEEVKLNGKTLSEINQLADTTFKEELPETRIQTDVNVPSTGLHQTIIQLPSQHDNSLSQHITRRSPAMFNVPRETENSVNKLEIVDGIQYSPLDVAEYVFWTGDEKGVTFAIQEFLQEGLISREEALVFLQEIKLNLDNLKNHYSQLEMNVLQRAKSEELSQKHIAFDKKHATYEKPELWNVFNIKQLRHESDKKRSLELPLEKVVTEEKSAEDEYDQLLERLRVADFLYTEYSLEEVIYQLAKLMFAQSLTHSNAEAQQALQKFTNFLEAEASQGHISRALEKKVLDVLIASLTDTLSEHPEILASAKTNMGSVSTKTANQSFIKEILNSNLESRLPPKEPFNYYKEENKNFPMPRQLSRNEHLPFDFFKYKNI